MRDNVQKPEELPGWDHSPDSKRYRHPAFGQITASRVTAGGTGQVLYGTDFRHHSFIEVTIRRSELTRDLSHDWHMGGDQLITVRLSEAQWATFVSSLNSGDGPCCTIKHVLEEDAPGIPFRQQRDAFQQEIRRQVAGCVKEVDDTIAAVNAELERLPQKRRAAIIHRLEMLRQELASNLPYTEQQFGKHMDHVVENAKVEVNAYVTNAVQRAGMAAIAGQVIPPVEPPLQLGAGTSSDMTRSE